MRGRTTMYRGVRMRSRLEAFFAQWLDIHGLTWEYEPMCFADETGQYLPDFLVAPIQVEGHREKRLYVEVKPSGVLSKDPDAMAFHQALRQRMRCIWASEPDAYLAIVSPDDATFSRFDLQYRVPDRRGWTQPMAAWVVCVRCGSTTVDDDNRLCEPFGEKPTWACPSCHVNHGFEIEIPWHSAAYYQLVGAA